MDETTRILVDVATSMRGARLPGGAVHGAKRQYLDGVGCAAGGFAAEPCRIVRTIAASAAATPGVSAYGLPTPTTPEHGAFANGCATRQLDFNDCYTGTVVGGGHPSDFTPAIVGAVEATGGSGEDVVRGIYAAYEIYAAIADTVAIRDLGFDQGVNVAVSTAAAAALVMGLDEAGIANAISLAITPALPLRVTRTGELSHWKGCAAPYAAGLALGAAFLARAGLTGPPRPFDGVDALSRVTGPLDLRALGEPIDGQSAVERCLIKSFPSELSSQAPVSVALGLRERLTVADVASIHIETFHLAWHEIGGGQGDAAEKWDPQTRETADHSLPYLVAVALVDGAVTPASFTPERIADPALRPLMAKISVSADPALENRFRTREQEMVARFTVRLRGGQEVREDVVFPRGHPRNPMSDDELHAKFMSMAPLVLPDADAARLGALLWGLEELPDLRELTGLLRRWTTRA